MAYSEKLLDHYEHPRNVGSLDKNDPDVGTGLVGAPACGDVMKLQIKVDGAGVIQDAKFKTFGCGSAIASSSLVTEWVKGKTVDEAMQIKNTEIVQELSLPPVKIHCSVLAEDAIKSAIAEPQPNVLNLASTILPVDSSTMIWSFMTSPHSGAPTMPVPTLGASLGSEPTLRGCS